MTGPDFLLFLLLSLCSYRVQRIITTDSWPPSEWFREAIEERFGPNSGWALFFQCPWCFGLHLTLAVFAWADFLIGLRLPIAQAVAATVIVGFLGENEK